METFFPRRGKKLPKKRPQNRHSAPPQKILPKHPKSVKNTVFSPFSAHFQPIFTPNPPCFAPKVFHAMETFFAIFPRYGKYFSTPWKAECQAKVQRVGRMANARSIAHGECRASERDLASAAAAL
ncbi:MAG: hypothetical protein GX803_07515 [Lentisphaerae bacterium]|jgi:hypothetical protein|nr:hypothetical protein [Lentisphaerota bacterium]